MSDFSVKVWLVEEPVINHPNADRLTIVKIGGYECIANKHEDGSFRYNEGDAVLYIPEGALVPEWLLKRLDMWNETDNKGFLAGSLGNRVKAVKLRGILSQGILYSVSGDFDEPLEDEYCARPLMTMELENETIEVEFDVDYAETLGITKYEPLVPVHMAGEVMALFGIPVKYDFENLKSVPDMFDKTDLVVATEKLHGTFVQFGIIPDFYHNELFGKNKNIYICSKGLGSQGFVFKNNEANKNNLYIKAIEKLLNNGLDDHLNDAINDSGKAFRIFGEVYGRGVQDLQYDCKEPTLAVFDMMYGDDFLPYPSFVVNAAHWHIPMVPELYRAEYNYNELLKLRDGKTMLGGNNIREGLVIKSYHNLKHHTHGRKIAKMVSPDYLLRKGDVTEHT